MSLLRLIKQQLGLSVTPSENHFFDGSTANQLKLKKGTPDNPGIDVMTVDSAGLVSLTQGRQLTLGTVQNSTSGTSIDFTNIPGWVKRITVMTQAVSVSGSSAPIIQLGDSGGIETTGYAASASIVSTGVNTTAYTTGFGLVQVGVAAESYSGIVTLCLLDAATNLWVAGGTTARTVGGAGVTILAGHKSLSATLDRIRITSVNGTDTFDAGSVNIMYEG